MKKQDSNMTRLTKKLLNETFFDVDQVGTLDSLISVLESKNDPDPLELYMYESLTHLREKMKIAESRLRNYLDGKPNHRAGSRLSTLYEESDLYDIDSIDFDD